MPHQHPCQLNHDEPFHHRPHAKGSKEQGHADDTTEEGDRAEHVNRTAAMREQHILENRNQWHERPADAEILDDAGTLYPSVGDGGCDKLYCHQREAEEQGETQEGCEADEFAQDVKLAIAVFAGNDHHGLRYLAEHSLQQIDTFVVPLVGLVEDAGGTR